MSGRNRAIWILALGAFSIGTILTLGYVTSGGSLFFVRPGWPGVAFYPGFLVSYHIFDFVGYNAAITLSCLTVGLAYSALASGVAVALRKAQLAQRLLNVSPLLAVAREAGS
jgi:hypothetical protein